MKKYNSYKESDISWLGEIPKHWQVSKVKHILFHKKKTSNPELNCGSISFGEIVYKDDESIPEHTKAAYQELLVGEFLINPLNLNFDLKSLRTALSDKDVVVSTGYIVLKNDDKTDKRFIKWLLHQFDVSFMKTLGAGVRQTLNYTDVKNSYFPVLPKQEQTIIANFLDYKTEKINRFIKKKKQLIELLKEQKAAIINQAVTKGINPNVPMKDSGIEWLGKIPEHWEVSRFKNICKVRQGLQIAQSDRLDTKEENCYEYITIKSINNPTNPKEYIQNPSKNVICDKDDILVSRTGSTGEIVTNVEGVFHNNFFLVNYYRNKVKKEFLFYYLTSSLIKEHLLLVAGTTTVSDLNHGEFYKTPFFEFQLEEQGKIVDFIKKESKIIEKTISTIQREITLVEEYKTALIAEAVTGKIDVRDFKIPTQETPLAMVAEEAANYNNR